MQRQIHFGNPKTWTQSRPRPMLLPSSATFYFLEVFLPFAAPPVAGALLGLPPLTLAGGASLAAFDPVGALASALGALVPELVEFAVRRVLVRFSWGMSNSLVWVIQRVVLALASRLLGLLLDVPLELCLPPYISKDGVLGSGNPGRELPQ